MAIWFTCEDLDAATELAGVTTGCSWAPTLVGSIQVFALAEARIAYARDLTFVYICYKAEQPNGEQITAIDRETFTLKWSRSTNLGIHQ